MKFAYLIMAHNNQKQLKLLIKSLDYLDNDIYLHIDKKSKDIDKEEIIRLVKHANLYMYTRYKVYWGDISQTLCQFFLLKKATRHYHDFYHLISGQDLLIKTHDELSQFFKNNKDKEFIHCESHNYSNKEANIFYHFLFPLIIRAKNPKMRKKLKEWEESLLNNQKKKGIHRNFYCGANWFSISHSLALDFIRKKRKLIRKVMFTISSDELVLQTYIKEYAERKINLYSDKEDDYESISRCIDWQRGGPYVWRLDDYDELINSGKCFARKFDEKIDSEIIKKIAKTTGIDYEN